MLATIFGRPFGGTFRNPLGRLALERAKGLQLNTVSRNSIPTTASISSNTAQPSTDALRNEVARNQFLGPDLRRIANTCERELKKLSGSKVSENVGLFSLEPESSKDSVDSDPFKKIRTVGPLKSECTAVNTMIKYAYMGVDKNDDYKLIINNYLFPRLEMLTKLYSHFETPASEMELNMKTKLRWYLTMHPTLSLRDGVRDALQNTCDLLTLYLTADNTSDKTELSYILYKIAATYPTPEKALSFDINHLSSEFVKSRICNEVKRAWANTSQFSAEIPQRRSYQVERNILNYYALLVWKQVSVLSDYFGKPIEDLMELNRWSLDGDGKDFPLSHAVYPKISGQLTITGFGKNLVKTIQRTAQSVNNSNSIDVCVEILKDFENMESELVKGTFLSEEACKKYANDISEKLFDLAKELDDASSLADANSLSKDVRRLVKIILHTNFTVAQDVFRQEGCRFQEALIQLGGDFKLSNSEFLSKALDKRIADLDENTIQDIFRLVLLQQGSKPELIISQTTSAEDIVSAILLINIAPKLITHHKGFQDLWHKFCKENAINEGCLTVNPSSKPLVYILTEGIKSILTQTEIMELALKYPVVLSYFIEMGGAGDVKSLSDGSRALGPIVRLLHDLNETKMKSLFDRYNLSLQSYRGVGETDILRMGATFYPSSSRTLQGACMMGIGVNVFYHLLFASNSSDDITRSFSPAELIILRGIIEKMILRHIDFEFGEDNEGRSTALLHSPSMVLTRDVGLSGPLAFSSARAPKRSGLKDSQEEKGLRYRLKKSTMKDLLEKRRINMVNEYACSSQIFPAVSLFTCDFSSQELNVLSKIFISRPELRDVLFNALIAMFLYDRAVYASFMGVNLMTRQQRDILADSQTSDCQQTAHIQRYAKMDSFYDAVLSNLLKIMRVSVEAHNDSDGYINNEQFVRDIITQFSSNNKGTELGIMADALLKRINRLSDRKQQHRDLFMKAQRVFKKALEYNELGDEKNESKYYERYTRYMRFLALIQRTLFNNFATGNPQTPEFASRLKFLEDKADTSLKKD